MPACSRADVQSCSAGFEPNLGGSDRPLGPRRELRRLRYGGTGQSHRAALPAELGPHRNRHGRQPLGAHGRSEEHTSELQSLAYLVCRLLLEKKKKQEQIRLYPLQTNTNTETQVA